MPLGIFDNSKMGIEFNSMWFCKYIITGLKISSFENFILSFTSPHSIHIIKYSTPGSHRFLQVASSTLC